jgi:lipopolysaccharide transport protein LptA
MAHSRTSSPGFRLAAALLTGLLGAAARAAPAACTDQDIIVDAKPGFELDYRKNSALLRDVTIHRCDMRIEAAEARASGGIGFDNSRWTFTGDVRIQSAGGNLRSDRAVVEFRDNLISEAVITGTPAEFEQKRDDGRTAKGHANTISYDARGGKISLRENAWLSDGCSEIAAPQFVYNITAQRVEGQSRTSTSPTGDGRVRFTIQPKSESSNSGPCSKKAPDSKP